MSLSDASGYPGVVSEITAASPGRRPLTSTPYIVTSVENPPATIRGSAPESCAISTNIRPVIGSAWSDDGNVTATCSADPAGDCTRQPTTTARRTRRYRVMRANVRLNCYFEQ